MKVACALALLGFQPQAKEAPGHALPVQQGVLAPSPATPVVSSPVPVVAGCLSASQVADYARRAGFTEAQVPQMVAYAYRESHYCPGEVNSSSGACGVWQLYPCPGPQAMEPMANAWLAREKCLASEASGAGCFAPWGG